MPGKLKIPSKDQILDAVAVFLAIAVPIAYFIIIFNLRRIFGGWDQENLALCERPPNGRPFFGQGRGLFHEPGFFESLVRAPLLEDLEAFRGNGNGDLLVEFRHEDGLLLHVDATPLLPGRVELGRTRAVRIPTSDAAPLPSYDAYT